MLSVSIHGRSGRPNPGENKTQKATKDTKNRVTGPPSQWTKSLCGLAIFCVVGQPYSTRTVFSEKCRALTATYSPQKADELLLPSRPSDEIHLAIGAVTRINPSLIFLVPMCIQCDDHSADHSVSFTRRGFLKLAGTAVLSSTFLARSQGAEVSAPPKPENAISPTAALERLMHGNERYVQGTTKRHDFASERAALALGQNPFAGILGCADSRVGPEYAFDVGRGDVFVCRVAGNCADPYSIASFEYGVAVLGVPFILVLGHTKCGAVDAAIKAVKDGKEFPGQIPTLIDAIRPAVKAAQAQTGDLLNNAIKQNVILNVEALKSAGPILSNAVQQGKLMVTGGIYTLETGRVTLIT